MNNNSTKETQDLERVIALGLIVINSASKQTHARTHIDIHPTIIKTNDSTTGGEHSITNTIHPYIWYIFGVQVWNCYKAVIEYNHAHDTSNKSEECVLYFSKFPFVLLLFEHKKTICVEHIYLFIYFRLVCVARSFEWRALKICHEMIPNLNVN